MFQIHIFGWYPGVYTLETGFLTKWKYSQKLSTQLIWEFENLIYISVIFFKPGRLKEQGLLWSSDQ
jgi:hypothetical protein